MTKYVKPDRHELYLAKWLFFIRKHCLIKNPLVIKSKNKQTIPYDGLIGEKGFINIPDEIQNIISVSPMALSPGNQGFTQIILSDALIDVTITNNKMLLRRYLIQLIIGFKTAVFDIELHWIQKYKTQKVELPMYIYDKESNGILKFQDHKRIIKLPGSEQIIKLPGSEQIIKSPRNTRIIKI